MIRDLNHQLDAQWREFGTHLHVKPALMDKIEKDTSNVENRMLQLVDKWAGRDDGTGDLPRTWKTVMEAVESMGKGLLAEQLTQKYEVQLYI